MDNEQIIYVDGWRPSNEDEMFLIPDNKLVIIPFERIFGFEIGSKSISTFIIKRFFFFNWIITTTINIK